MLIGVDASRAVKQLRTGTENYSWYVIRELLELDKENNYRLYAQHLPGSEFGEYSNAEWRVIHTERLWSQIHLAKEVRQNPPDVLFVPSHVVPITTNVKSVVTIHDIAYKFFPEAYNSFSRRYLQFSTSVSLAKAKKILVPSQATKDDIIKYYKTPASKIVVTPLGYNSDIYNGSANNNAPPINDPYLIFVGRIEKKKNVSLLIDAFQLLAKEHKRLHLVLAGRPGVGYDQIKKQISSLAPELRDKIIEQAELSDADLATFVAHAKALVLPSLYEGFGLPVIEAMAVGTPVICSNTPALAEVAQDAAVVLPPEDPLRWAAELSRILNEPALAEKLRKKGIARAESFSWQRCAKQTLEVLNDVAK